MQDMNPVTPADLDQPLINEPAQSNPPAHTELGPLSNLLGTWTNQDIVTGKGGPESPFSYNIMPLPQAGGDGYILKNFSYYEEITFSAIHGTAPNRGGDFTQTANTIFYEQRVYFAEGPDKDKLVHAENGSWLWMTTGPQSKGPYSGEGNVPHSGPIPAQDPNRDIYKQISVPHGNSILVGGTFKKGTDGKAVISGQADIPASYGSVYPSPGVPVTQYSQQSVGNPNVAYTLNPNQPLFEAQELSPSAQYIEWTVDTSEQGVSVTNIPFEEKKADVTDYKASYWLQSLGSGCPFTRLSYIQTISLKIPINGKMISFPHVTCNTLTKKG